MADKPKIAFYWCASCGGCEEAIVDLAEDILTVVEKADIVFWPVALDFKKEDVEKMQDGEILVAFINGAIRLSDQEEMAKLLRKKAKVVIAFGACAQLGGIPGLANSFSSEEIIKYYYKEGPIVVNSEDNRPRTKAIDGKFEIELPEFYERVYSLDQIIDVDYYIPGCAPPRNIVSTAVNAIFSGELPAKGAIIGANTRALCYECTLNETKPEKISLTEFKRIDRHQPKPDECLLVQGFTCLGPVTRGGCEALCVKGNYPCTGCMGPLDEVKDYGAKAISFLGSVIGSNDEKEIGDIIEKWIPNPLAIVYKYSLPKSLIYRNKGVLK